MPVAYRIKGKERLRHGVRIPDGAVDDQDTLCRFGPTVTKFIYLLNQFSQGS